MPSQVAMMFKEVIMKEIKKDEFVSDWSIYENFEKWEFACPSSGKAYMQKRFMDKLQRARTIAGVSFHISSGYRDEAYNDSLPNSVPNSAHIYGLACDIWFDSMADRLKAFDAFREVGIKRIGISKGFMHVDVDDSKPEGIWGY